MVFLLAVWSIGLKSLSDIFFLPSAIMVVRELIVLLYWLKAAEPSPYKLNPGLQPQTKTLICALKTASTKPCRANHYTAHSFRVLRTWTLGLVGELYQAAWLTVSSSVWCPWRGILSRDRHNEPVRLSRRNSKLHLLKIGRSINRALYTPTPVNCVYCTMASRGALIVPWSILPTAARSCEVDSSRTVLLWQPKVLKLVTKEKLGVAKAVTQENKSVVCTKQLFFLGISQLGP